MTKKEKVLAELYSSIFKAHEKLSKELKTISRDDSLDRIKLLMRMKEMKEFVNMALAKNPSGIYSCVSINTVHLLTRAPIDLLNKIFKMRYIALYEELLSNESFNYYKECGYHVNEYKNMLYNCIIHDVPAYIDNTE